MPEKNINFQNLPCPQPVIRIKKIIDTEAPSSLSIIVDNAPACENVTRLLHSKGYEVMWTQEETLFYLQATASGPPPLPSPPTSDSFRGSTDPAEKVLVLVASEYFGTGDDSLGGKLMRNFLATLPEFGPSLWRMAFINGGVKLCTSESPVITEILALHAQGTSILVCGTCLEHFGVLHTKTVGDTTNMLDIVTSLQLADKVLRI